MTDTKNWLIQKNQTVMSVLLFALSVALIGDSIEFLVFSPGRGRCCRCLCRSPGLRR